MVSHYPAGIARYLATRSVAYYSTDSGSRLRVAISFCALGSAFLSLDGFLLLLLLLLSKFAYFYCFMHFFSTFSAVNERKRRWVLRGLNPEATTPSRVCVEILLDHRGSCRSIPYSMVYNEHSKLRALYFATLYPFFFTLYSVLYALYAIPHTLLPYWLGVRMRSFFGSYREKNVSRWSFKNAIKKQERSQPKCTKSSRMTTRHTEK